MIAILRELLRKRIEYVQRDGEFFFDAAQNARVVADAEAYYRAMYYGSAESWNLRDEHMFRTLSGVMNFLGPGARVAVWEHNSHVGDAAATQMAEYGEINVGHLSRRQWARDAYLVGFGTDHGTVAAAHDWDGPMEVMKVRPSHPDSYERLFHATGVPAFFLPLREGRGVEVLDPPRLERAIGVVYRPQTEFASHYFRASLPAQFDEYVWVDETRAVTALPAREIRGLPETFPFGV